MISIKTESWLSPHLIIPLAGVDVDVIYDYFLHHVEEDEHHHLAERVVPVGPRAAGVTARRPDSLVPGGPGGHHHGGAVGVRGTAQQPTGGNATGGWAGDLPVATVISSPPAPPLIPPE